MMRLVPLGIVFVCVRPSCLIESLLLVSVAVKWLRLVPVLLLSPCLLRLMMKSMWLVLLCVSCPRVRANLCLLSCVRCRAWLLRWTLTLLLSATLCVCTVLGLVLGLMKCSVRLGPVCRQWVMKVVTWLCRLLSVCVQSAILIGFLSVVRVVCDVGARSVCRFRERLYR